VGFGFAETHGYCPARLNAAWSLLSNVLSEMSKLRAMRVHSMQSLKNLKIIPIACALAKMIKILVRIFFSHFFRLF
jgi:hypothetical protein